MTVVYLKGGPSEAAKAFSAACLILCRPTLKKPLTESFAFPSFYMGQSDEGRPLRPWGA